MFRNFFTLACLGALLVSPVLFAQNTLDTGGLRGKVSDSKGKTLPGAIVRAKGPQGTKATETDGQGNFNLPFLTPGLYEVTASMDGYSTTVQSGVTIGAQQTSIQSFKLAEGSDVITVKAGAGVDTRSTASITKVNLSEAVKEFAQSRDFTAAFDFAPGSISNSGVGGGNPSIGGASGLENQYLVSGINITGAGYGTIGAYDVFGAKGTGMTTAFFDSMDIREGGFEAEYGGALGGVISANIKSGGNDFHGSVDVHYRNQDWEGARRILGRYNFTGETKTDLSLDFSGPIIKDKLFFYVGYNPVWSTRHFFYYIPPEDVALDGDIAPFANTDFTIGTNRADNVAAHLTWNITPNHKLDAIYMGSPQNRNGAIRLLGERVSTIDDPGLAGLGVPLVGAAEGVQGRRKLTDHAFTLKYFGILRPWVNIELQGTRHTGRVEEIPAGKANSTYYYDDRRADVYATFPNYTSGLGYEVGGLGYYQGGMFDQNTNLHAKLTFNFSFLGSHELKAGYEYGRYEFRQNLTATGVRPEIFLNAGPQKNSSYATIRSGSTVRVTCGAVAPAGTDFNSACTGANYQIYSGAINPVPETTYNRETNIFLQDTWTIKNVTLRLGVRYTHEKISNPQNFKLTSNGDPTTGAGRGNPLIGGNGQPVGTRTFECVTNGDYSASCYPGGFGAFIGTSYEFKGEYAPRIGISWDMFGNGKSRLYANYGRLYERVPNNLAVRSFGNEFSIFGASFNFPDLTGPKGAARAAGTTPTRVVPGTRLPFKDDVILGYQFELPNHINVDVKANYRKQGRVLEDTQTASVESILNLYYSYLLNYNCTNCTAGATDLFPGYGASYFNEYVLANVGENSDNFYYDINDCVDINNIPASCTKIPVNFGKPENRYQALSVTVQRMRQEGEHLSFHATYRISRLTGNYEGLFRNDNGQSDPNISSLYDFPNTPLTESQFFNGRLNTDTPHVLRVLVAYQDLFIKNLSAAVTYKRESGQMRTPLLAHPIYGNAGEIPGIDRQYFNFDPDFDGDTDFRFLRGYTPVQRGHNGRLADIATWDFKLGYGWKLGKSNMKLDVLVENLFNNNQVTGFDDYVENSFDVPNPSYGKPYLAHEPRSVRVGLHWSF